MMQTPRVFLFPSLGTRGDTEQKSGSFRNILIFYFIRRAAEIFQRNRLPANMLSIGMLSEG
jgi:hypothetical protein